MPSWTWQACLENYVGKRIDISTNCAGTTVRLHIKEWIWTPISHQAQKLTKNG